MSLLSRGTEVVTVYPEEVATDADGNTRTRPSATGVVCRAVVQPITSAVAVGNQESQEIGFLTERSTGYGWSDSRHCSGLSRRSSGRASVTPSKGSQGSTTGAGERLTSITSSRGDDTAGSWITSYRQGRLASAGTRISQWSTPALDADRLPSTPLILAAIVIPDRTSSSRRASVSEDSHAERYVPPVGRYSQRASRAGVDSSSAIWASKASSCFCSRCFAVADTARPAALVSSSNPFTASRSSASWESPVPRHVLGPLGLRLHAEMPLQPRSPTTRRGYHSVAVLASVVAVLVLVFVTLDRVAVVVQ